MASSFAVMGVIYTCLTAIRQIDLKKIIAYSSVGHMNVVLLGILSGTSEGIQGAIFQMLSHGVVAGALFFAVGTIYERYSVRSLKYFDSGICWNILGSDSSQWQHWRPQQRHHQRPIHPSSLLDGLAKKIVGNYS